jgi:hypothetical protein
MVASGRWTSAESDIDFSRLNFSPPVAAELSPGDGIILASAERTGCTATSGPLAESNQATEQR